MPGSCTAKPIHKVGSSNIVVLHTVKLRPPKIGTTNEYRARKTAPESPGSAASQKSWLVVNLNPMCGNSTTITLHTTQTAKASSSGGIDTRGCGWRFAGRSPPEALVVGPPIDEHVPAPPHGLDQLGAGKRRARRGVLLRILALVPLGHPHPDHGDDDHGGDQHEAAAAHADHVGGDAEHDRQRESAQAADDADDAADDAHVAE